MPSSRQARNAMAELLADTGSGPVYELGSGWGGLAIGLAKKYPNRQIVGYEVSFFPWLVSVVVKRVLGLGNLVIYRRNFLLADLSAADVFVCFLDAGNMRAISHKLRVERSRDGFLISNFFALPCFQADNVIKIDDLYMSPVYRYKLRRGIAPTG
jgi:hypothetical protein